MDFRERLQKATERGQKAADTKRRREAAAAISEEECRRLHTHCRLELTERIEECLRHLADNFPGFRHETLMKDRGWGAAVSRDDVNLSGGSRANEFSRFEVVVRPYNEFHVLELASKATVRNKEIFTRNYFQQLNEADLVTFQETIDQWTLEFAERYAAES